VITDQWLLLTIITYRYSFFVAKYLIVANSEIIYREISQNWQINQLETVWYLVRGIKLLSYLLI